MQFNDNNNKMTQVLYFLGTKDENITKHLLDSWDTSTHHNIQNELLHLIVYNVLRVKILTIRQRKLFSIMADEGIDFFSVLWNNSRFV